ncbi:hypothetical protein VTN00DRAFT_8306 [Thermoascus crustaceus]|uniref:uncharacterized protein n=1 Tax=Thermoascus crustaceus TaxID=5088 RepID=UPI003743D977
MQAPRSNIPALAYEETVAAQAPVPIKSVSSPTPVETKLPKSSDTTTVPGIHVASIEPVLQSEDGKDGKDAKDRRQNPGLALSTSMTKDSRTAGSVDDVSASSLKSPRSIPSIVVDDVPARPSSRWSERRWGGLRSRKSTESERREPPAVPADTPFHGITMNIPTGSFEDLGLQSVQFSKRGSVLSENKSNEDRVDENTTNEIIIKAPPTPNSTATPEQSSLADNSPANGVRRTDTKYIRPSNSLRVTHSSSSTRAISTDEDMLSRRVRLMYERGEEEVSDSEVAKALAQENGILWEETTPNESGTDAISDVNPSMRSASSLSTAKEAIKRDSHELAGGIEDWKDIQAGDVDRYGFIIPRCNDGHRRESAAEPPSMQRVSTSLLLASEAPRRKHTVRRAPSTAASNRSFGGRPPSRKMSEPSNRPTSSQSGYQSSLQRSGSRFRYATNRLPHNRDRRVRDEASDMLTNPCDVPNTVDDHDSPAARAMRKKEWEREDKWTKMAKPTKKTKDGGGMTFEFDTSSPKLIERTWKGIPDTWRATAWYAFLAASAKKRKDSPTEEELIQAFYEFQNMSSPDDVQIDIDVPRTISSHIMFRRRYRGGQRLLFRVLHAMSLYFPDTGYVQGMAALAATLLSYYDEEHAFVMLVRLWQLRGLDRLYRSGFAGLMEALDDFEKEWLEGGEVAAKLNELGIPPTAYGTRWYLTLFNYSIPFPAQLRVWDVFMLLGDSDEPVPSRPPTNTSDAANPESQPAASPFGKSLDVLHATSAALIDGMREIILESDFENAMKVLTSWVPIKDVELFMRVAKAEWKVHHRKKMG